MKELDLQNAGLPETGQAIGYAHVWTLLALVLAVFYLATSIYISLHRPFWYDEIVTYNVATLPDYRTIWSAVTHAVDGGSPVYDVVVRVWYQMFGEKDVVARLPSALAMVAGMLIVFDCARRLTDNLHGLIALAVLTCSFLPYYGHEARAYAIYFMLSALALWVWLNTRQDSRWSAVLFGAVIFLAVAMHYYAALLLVPYVLWEAIRWRPWKLPSARLMAGILGAVVAAVLLLPAIRSFVPIVTALNPWTPTSFDRLREIYDVFFPDGLWLLALIAIWIALVSTRKREIDLPPMSSAETLGWLFICIPLAGFVAAELKTKSFGARYFIGTLPGIAVAFSCALWRNFNRAWRVSLGILLLLATYGMAKQGIATRHPDLNGPAPHDAKLEDTLRKEGKQYFLITNQARYWEAYHYSKHPEQYFYLASLDSGDLRLTMNFSHYIPVQFWTLEDIKKHARETALVAPYPRIVETLKQAGIQVETRFSAPQEVFYLQ